MTRLEAWRYIALLVWVQFRMLFHRRCNYTTCETKARLFYSVFKPIGYIDPYWDDLAEQARRSIQE